MSWWPLPWITFAGLLLPPVIPEDTIVRVAAWAFGGIGTWVAVQTWKNGKLLVALAMLVRGEDKQNGLLGDVAELRADMRALQAKMETYQEDIRDAVSGPIAAFQVDWNERLGRVEDNGTVARGRLEDRLTELERLEANRTRGGGT